jgi:hypothetical protein
VVENSNFQSSAPVVQEFPPPADRIPSIWTGRVKANRNDSLTEECQARGPRRWCPKLNACLVVVEVEEVPVQIPNGELP